MSKKVLILTTGKGGGHKSSSEAVKNAILELDPNIDVNTYDAMKFFPGYTGEDQTGYISLTTRYRYFWKCFFEITSFFRGISNTVLSKPIYKRFCNLILEYKPDVILSVHPCFVGSIIKCLKRMKKSIPVYTCIVDLVKYSYLWHDKKSEITFVPTKKMYNLLLKKGFRVIHSGFPINEKFQTAKPRSLDKLRMTNVLMVNPSR